MQVNDYRAKLLCTAMLLSSASHADEPPFGAGCQRDFAAIDDRADEDIRAINRLIVSLENEIADPALSSSPRDLKDGLKGRIDVAKLRRSAVFAKQHDDLNAVRERCGRLRGEKPGAVELRKPA